MPWEAAPSPRNFPRILGHGSAPSTRTPELQIFRKFWSLRTRDGHAQFKSSLAYIYIHIYIYTYVHTFMLSYIHVIIHINAYIACMHTYIDIHTYILSLSRCKEVSQCAEGRSWTGVSWTHTICMAPHTSRFKSTRVRSNCEAGSLRT